MRIAVIVIAVLVLFAPPTVRAEVPQPPGENEVIVSSKDVLDNEREWPYAWVSTAVIAGLVLVGCWVLTVASTKWERK